MELSTACPVWCLDHRVRGCDEVSPGIRVGTCAEFVRRYEAFASHRIASNNTNGIASQSIDLDNIASHRTGQYSGQANRCSTLALPHPLDVFAVHMQRKLAGHARALIYLAQDFMAVALRMRTKEDTSSKSANVGLPA